MKSNLPQAVCSSLGTVFTPSHVPLQLVSFPTDDLMVFPEQIVQESPSWKYPGLQTLKQKQFQN